MALQIKTKSLIRKVQLEFYNGDDSVKLKHLAEKYGLSYDYVKTVSCREKWRQKREEYREKEKTSETDGLWGIKLINKELGNNLQVVLMLLTEIANDPETYLTAGGDKISMSKLKEYLACLKSFREEAYNVYNSIPYSERVKIDLAISKLGVALNKVYDGEGTNPISDNFIESLKAVVD